MTILIYVKSKTLWQDFAFGSDHLKDVCKCVFVREKKSKNMGKKRARDMDQIEHSACLLFTDIIVKEQ